MQVHSRLISLRLMLSAIAMTAVVATGSAVPAADNTPPEGFVALFNGRDLTGWKGLVATDNPFKRAELSPEALAAEQTAADKLMHEHWKVEDLRHQRAGLRALGSPLPRSD